MEIVIGTVQEAAERAADLVEALLRRDPQAVLGLATGSSPLGLYDELARRHREHALSFAGATAFLLDEYVGLPVEHPQRYRSVITRELVERVDLDPARVHTPDDDAADLVAAAAAYDAAIASAGGVDLQVLGLGTDGHLAFNEPGSSLASRTRVKTLLPQTRADNARFFDGDPDAVPTHVLTQGLGTIMDARHLVLIATGVAKAPAVRELAEGAVSAHWPATVLQHHPRVTVLVDDDAAGLLQRADEHRSAWAGRLTAFA